MNCAELNELLDKLMDGELTDEQRRAMSSHGRDCPQCADEIRRTMQLKALFDEMEPEADVPLAAQAKWRGAIREEAVRRKRRRLYRWAATAAAAVVVLTGLGLTVNGRLASPQTGAAVQVAEEMAAASDADSAMPLPEPKSAGGAVVEADGIEAAMNAAPRLAESAAEADFEEEYAGEAVAAPAMMAPACELALVAEDVDTACERVQDLVREYEGELHEQRLEDGSANLYVELPAENAEDFLNAALPMDQSGQPQTPPEFSGEGDVLVLLTVRGLDP